MLCQLTSELSVKKINEYRRRNWGSLRVLLHSYSHMSLHRSYWYVSQKTFPWIFLFFHCSLTCTLSWRSTAYLLHLLLILLPKCQLQNEVRTPSMTQSLKICPYLSFQSHSLPCTCTKVTWRSHLYSYSSIPLHVFFSLPRMSLPASVWFLVPPLYSCIMA